MDGLVDLPTSQNKQVQVYSTAEGKHGTAEIFVRVTVVAWQRRPITADRWSLMRYP